MKHLNDNQLLKETNRLRKIEQTTTAELLKYFAEINRRRLFADVGCSSLYEYLTQKMKYSEGQAARRISAMRLVQSNPLAKKKIESGQLNLANASEVSRHFSREKLTTTEQNKIIEKVSGKSKRQCLQILAPEEVDKPREITRQIDKQTSRITFNVSEELMDKLQKVKEICGKHKYEEMLEKICDSYIETHQKKIKKEGKVKPTKDRTISTETKRKLQQRSGGQCEWRHPVTGKHCNCKDNLEIDHVIPYAKGGSNELNNLRLYCKAHNQRAAIKEFGQNKMDQFINNDQLAPEKVIKKFIQNKITSPGKSKSTNNHVAEKVTA